MCNIICPLFNKRTELMYILQTLMMDEIGIFTVYATLVFETDKPDMLRITYIRVDNENNRLELTCELPDDFKPEVTAGAIFDTLTQKSRSNIKVIEK